VSGRHHPRLKAPEGLSNWFECLIREHIHDEDARRDAFSCLKELRRERAALILGVGTTLRYLVEHNELPEEDKPSKPPICPISSEAMDEFFLWQERITAEMYGGDRPSGSA
jgi:hypothetical protein